jgi:hypothetical protein
VNPDPTIGGLPAGSVVQGVSSVVAALIALGGVALGAVLTGGFAIIVAGKNREAQIAAQGVAASSAHERERRAELREAQSEFCTAATAYFRIRTEMDMRYAKDQRLRDCNNRPVPNSQEAIKENSVLIGESEAKFTPAWDRFNNARFRVMLLERSPDWRKSVDEAFERLAGFTPRDLPPGIDATQQFNSMIVAIYCQKDLRLWIEAQAQRTDPMTGD